MRPSKPLHRLRESAWPKLARRVQSTAEVNGCTAIDQNTGAYHGPLWLGVLATTEVGQGPSGVAQHGQFVGIFVQDVQQRTQGTLAQNEIAATRTITSNVSEGPYSLLSKR